MPVLGLDIDDTSAKYMKGLKSYIIEAEPEFFAGMSPTEVDKHFPSMATYDSFEWSLIKGDRDKFIKYHTEAVDKGLFCNLEPMKNVSSRLWQLKEQHDFQIYVITSRFVKNGQHARVLTDTAIWLDNNNIPYDDIMFARKKVDVVADVYIDDSEKNITALRGVGRKVITYDRTYNRHIEGMRALNWDDAYNQLSVMF